MPIFLFGVLTLSGCSNKDSVNEDAEYRQRILGNWFQTQRFSTEVIIEREFTYRPDGTYESYAKRFDKEQVYKYQTKGRWKIENGILSYTILDSTHPRIPVGYKSRSRIVRISNTEKVVQDANGQRIVSNRRE